MPERIPWSSLEFFSVLLPHKRRELLFLSSCFDSDWIRINFNNLKNHWLKIAQTRSFWPPPPQSRPPTSPSSSFPNIFEWCVHATLQPTWLEHNTRWPRMKKKKKKKNRECKGWKSNKLKNFGGISFCPKVKRTYQTFGSRQFDSQTEKGLRRDGRSPTEAWPLVRSSSKLPKNSNSKPLFGTDWHLISLLTESNRSSHFPGIRRYRIFFKKWFF